MTETKRQENAWLAPSQVAQMLMVSPATVRLWASKGDLRSVPTPGGHRRFFRQEIERFARERNLTLQVPGSDQLRILIVDDNRQVTRYLERLLSTREAVETMSAHDGYSAGRLVQVFKPDIVLLDLLMPGLDGFEVCTQIRSDPAHSHVRVIVMTGYSTPENVEKAHNAGAEFCLVKPIDDAVLFHQLELDQERVQA